MKKRIGISLLVILLMTSVLSGCGFSIGNSSNDEDYKSLFPDKAEALDKSYKTSNMGYKFSLGEDYGEMMVYVDTSEGHTFELMTDSPAGFTINDKDGNVALYAVCMDRSQYEMYSIYASDVKKVNGRDFLYMINGDGSEDCFSYMADCGLDCGFVLEVHDGATENFGLVAFRGDALDGASSDVYYYQGSIEEPELDTTEAEEELSDIEDAAETDTEEAISMDKSLTVSTLDADVENLLNKLTSDYNNVYWGARYSIFEDMPAIVVSVTPCKFYDEYALAVAITNLYDEEFSFSGSAQVLGSDDSVIGDSFMYIPCLGSTNTVVQIVPTGSEIPDGRIHWEDCEISEPYGEFVPWESDWGISGNPADGYITVDYNIYAADGGACSGDSVMILLVDESGFILACATDYIDSIEDSAGADGSVVIFGDETLLNQTKNLAMFTNLSR